MDLLYKPNIPFGFASLIPTAVSVGLAIAGGVMAILGLFHHTNPPPKYNGISGTFLIKGKQQQTFINNLTKTRDTYTKGSAKYNEVQNMINNTQARIANNQPIVNYKGADGKLLLKHISKILMLIKVYLLQDYKLWD